MRTASRARARTRPLLRILRHLRSVAVGHEAQFVPAAEAHEEPEPDLADDVVDADRLDEELGIRGLREAIRRRHRGAFASSLALIRRMLAASAVPPAGPQRVVVADTSPSWSFRRGSRRCCAVSSPRPGAPRRHLGPRLGLPAPWCRAGRSGIWPDRGGRGRPPGAEENLARMGAYAHHGVLGPHGAVRRLVAEALVAGQPTGPRRPGWRRRAGRPTSTSSGRSPARPRPACGGGQHRGRRSRRDRRAPQPRAPGRPRARPRRSCSRSPRRRSCSRAAATRGRAPCSTQQAHRC